MLNARMLVSIFVFIMLFTSLVKAAPGEYYQIKIYLMKTAEQEAKVDQYLKNGYLPALHRAGIEQVGVFRSIGNDTASIRRIVLLIPYKSLQQWETVSGKLASDARLIKDDTEYVNAPHNDPPYTRIESILLKSFVGMPHYGIPDLKAPKSERIYELRSYEGPTEKKYLNKVDMFNKGDEVGLFKRLGFNAVFYAEVISGAHMPNLMYMTTFENMDSHDQHWKSFGADPYWKKLSAMPEYQNNVSHADIMLMHPTEYSDL